MRRRTKRNEGSNKIEYKNINIGDNEDREYEDNEICGSALATPASQTDRAEKEHQLWSIINNPCQNSSHQPRCTSKRCKKKRQYRTKACYSESN